MAFNILVADDSGTMRQVIKKVVDMSGVPIGEFYEAANGLEALKVLEEQWVDVVLSDINMPQMDGMSFLKEMKANEVYKSIPVIFVTTEASEARMAEAQRLGVAGYIKKPFQPETIKAQLYAVLEKAYAHRLEELGGGGGEAGGDDLDF